MSIERKCEWNAVLSGGKGTKKYILDDRVPVLHTLFNSDIVRRCGNNGKFLSKSDLYEISEVVYSAYAAEHFWDKEHWFSFQEYVSMSRPDNLVIRKVMNYSSTCLLQPNALL